MRHCSRRRWRTSIRVVNTMALPWILKRNSLSLMLFYASMHALGRSIEAVSFAFSFNHKNLLLLSKERKSLFTLRGSWVCGQPAGLSKRRWGNCEAVIHGRGISTAVSKISVSAGDVKLDLRGRGYPSEILYPL
jgi:hypothetical protein